jgi:hypothetical protein
MKHSFLLTAIGAAVLCTLGCSQRSQPASESSSSPSKPASFVTVDPNTAGQIAGVVNFSGAVPKLPSIDMTADPMCPQKSQPAETVAVKDGKLANVFVYVKEGLPQGTFPTPPTPVVLSQQACRYTPRVMGIMVKQPFKIVNDDQANHNIHDMPSHNPQWNEEQQPTDKPITKSFPNPEMMLPLQCNQHPWMRAYVNVMTHPYFAVTGDDGKFEIKDLPPGEYTLAAVHEKFGEKTVKVTVAGKESAKAQFSFSAAP